jgi:hypothetical protein
VFHLLPPYLKGTDDVAIFQGRAPLPGFSPTPLFSGAL